MKDPSKFDSVFWSLNAGLNEGIANEDGETQWINIFILTF